MGQQVQGYFNQLIKCASFLFMIILVKKQVRFTEKCGLECLFGNGSVSDLVSKTTSCSGYINKTPRGMSITVYKLTINMRVYSLFLSAVLGVMVQGQGPPVCPSLLTQEGLLERMVSLETRMQQVLDTLEDDIQKHSGTTRFSSALKVENIEVDGWEMVFRATSSNGHSVIDAWQNGVGTNPDKPMSMERSHGLHYRSPDVASWDNLGVEKVKFAFYDQDKEVAQVTFNGVGSNINNWFDKSKVSSSSWPDLTSSSTYNYFSIEGHHIATRHDRRFFINKSYGGCPKDLGHMVVINSETPAVCLWDNHATYPQFLYSKINSIDFWDRRMFGTADFMAILIKRS